MWVRCPPWPLRQSGQTEDEGLDTLTLGGSQKEEEEDEVEEEQEEEDLFRDAEDQERERGRGLGLVARPLLRERMELG